MTCPKCGTPIPKGRATCTNCGARIALPSKRAARQFRSSARLTMACGGVMLILALVLFLYGVSDLYWQILLIGLGLAFMFVGRKLA